MRKRVLWCLWLAVITVSAVMAQTEQGRVSLGYGYLNLRAEPSTRAAVVGELSDGTTVTLLGRSADRRWVHVKTASGLKGWAAVRYMSLSTSIANLPVVNAGGSFAPVAVPQLTRPDRLTPQTATASATSGPIATHFSKVGDSITMSEYSVSPLGYSPIQYGPHEGLAAVVAYFSQGNENSFTRTSRAAQYGWTSADVLNPAQAAGDCGGASPLVCEYRQHRPRVALIAIGSNDVASLSAEQYTANLSAIIATSLEMGITPLVATIPYRVGYSDAVNQFNGIIHATAARYGVRVWDYSGAMWGLPDHGLSVDGLHPSNPPDLGLVVNFADEIKYGYTLRNLMVLQALAGEVR